MTRLEQLRVRRTKYRTTQVQLEAALDAVIPTLELLPSAAFDAILAYALDGLIAQGTVSNKEQALRYVSRVLASRGMI